jgi:hypothetical protein
MAGIDDGYKNWAHRDELDPCIDRENDDIPDRVGFGDNPDQVESCEAPQDERIPHVLTDPEAEVIAGKWFAKHHLLETLKDFWRNNVARNFDEDDLKKLHEAAERLLADKKAPPKNRAVQPLRNFAVVAPEQCPSCDLTVNDAGNCRCG